MRTQETDVEVFGGEVESLTTAGIEGVGVRVIVDHRQGYASAGSLDPDVDRRDAARSARQRRVRRTRRVERARVARRRRRCRRRPTSTCGARSCVALPTEEKVRIALDLEAATKARDPRVRGVEAAGYGDARAESAIVNSLGVEAYTRRTTCSAHAVALADDGSGTQTGYGFAAGRSLADLDLESIPVDAVDRAVRLLGAEPIAGRRIPVDLRPARHPLRARRAVERVQRRDGARRAGRCSRAATARSHRGADRRDRRRPDRRARVRRRRLRQRRAADAPQRADRRRRAARLPAQHVHRPAIGAAQHRERGARRLHVGPGCRCARAHAAAGTALAGGAHGGGAGERSTCSR